MTKTSRIALSICVLLGVGSCDHSSQREPTSVLRRGLSSDLSSLDPAAAADTFSIQVLQDLYEGLTTESSTGAAVPGVAASWTVDSAGTQYTFHLRPDARWSN